MVTMFFLNMKIKKINDEGHYKDGIDLSKFSTRWLSILSSYQKHQELTGRLLTTDLITGLITKSKLNNWPAQVSTFEQTCLALVLHTFKKSI
jgi:hypothetical protein